MFKELLEDELNVSFTENGAIGYKTTKKSILDMFFKISSYRDLSDEDIRLDFIKVWYEDKELAIKFLFYIRDARQGVGERRVFRVCFNAIANELADTLTLVEKFFDYVLEYGRADDLFCLFGTKLEKQMVEYIQKLLFADNINANELEKVSLLAKWMPSCNTSSKETRALAQKFIRAFGWTTKQYRQQLSKLRKYIDVTEVKACANKWEEIDYARVPSLANLKYKNAFLKHDKKRREEYLEALENGETKINSSVAFPYQIVNKYDWQWTGRYDATLEEMWKALLNYVQGNSKFLVVRDGSGSMTVNVGNTNVTALDIATSLAIYFSERQEGEFKNTFITFSSEPRLIDLSSYTTLFDKLKVTNKERDCSNTNIKKTFELILDVATKNHLKQEDLPNLLIISDMEFDSATYLVDTDKLFNIIRKEFNEKGYELPKLVFWNVCSRTNTIPLTENENGVILLSGFSTSVVNMVLSNKLDPYEALVDVLNSDRYKNITLNM